MDVIFMDDNFVSTLTMPIANFVTTITPLSGNEFTGGLMPRSAQSEFTDSMSISQVQYKKNWMQSLASQDSESHIECSDWLASHTAAGCQVEIRQTSTKRNMSDGSIGSSHMEGK